ncbi:MAG: hypothetical protein HQ588_05190 [Deltaproteobacteria bacterium]|nr:hypothetical protein [Deltaproteobacteria bacterium]
MKLRILVGLSLLLVSLLVISPAAAILAQEEEEAPPETITLTTTYSKLSGIAGSSFEFEVGLAYTGGTEARVFDLAATGPQNWTTSITPSYPKDKQIQDIRLEPPPPFQAALVTKILVNLAPPYWLLPEPGDYQITVEAASGEIKGTIQLTAVVTSTYIMSLAPTEERLNTTATAGRDNYFSIEVNNNGSAAIDNITFSTRKPTGWTIEFSPEKIDTLAAQDSQTVEVNIKPPAKTIAGDYQISLTAKGQQISDDIDIRVSVETPTIWGWVGVAIIVLVIAGLVYIFMRFSRR